MQTLVSHTSSRASLSAIVSGTRSLERPASPRLTPSGRELGLRIGAAGQLVAEGRLKQVLPVEHAGALKAADPVNQEGEVRLDEKLQEAGEDAMVRRLLKARGLALVVLGGGHDLSDNVRRLGEGRCEYVRVRPEGPPL